MNKSVYKKKKEHLTKFGDYELKKKIFYKRNEKDYTILIPQMAPIHFELLETAVASCGYNVELVKRMYKSYSRNRIKIC